MERVNIREARSRFSAIIKAAERGQSTVITRRGQQVARVEPIGPAQGCLLPDLTEFRASQKAKGKPLSQIAIENRRESRY